MPHYYFPAVVAWDVCGTAPGVMLALFSYLLLDTCCFELRGDQMASGSIDKILTLKNQWLAERQAVTASNIANANTPGFKAQDLVSFDAALTEVQGRMTTTNARHISSAPEGTEFAREPQEGWETTYSDNNVSLEQELLKAAETTRAYSFNVNLDKAFGRMKDLALKDPAK